VTLAERRPRYDPDRRVRDPRICGGESVIRGSSGTVRTVLASPAEGATVQEIITDYPTISSSRTGPGTPTTPALAAR